MKNGISKKLVCGMMLGTLMASSTGVAFAATSTSAADVGNKPPSGMIGSQRMQSNPIETALTKLVSAGTITQAKADAIKTYMDSNKPTKPANDQTIKGAISGEKQGMFADLVQSGTITTAQQTAIEEAMQALHPAAAGNADKKDANTSRSATDMTQMQTQRTAELKTILDKLVTDGTMTQTTADAVTTSMASRETQMQQDKSNDTADKTKGPQQDTSMLTTLVTNGVITEADKTAIEAAVQASAPAHDGQPNDAGAAPSSK